MTERAFPSTKFAQSIDWDAIAGRPPFLVDRDAVGARVRGKVIAVTGAAGSLGAPLAHALAESGPARLVVIDHHEGTLFHLRQALAGRHPGVPVRAALVDVRSERRVRQVLMDERPALIFHLAAYKHVPWGEEDPEAFVDANVFGAKTLLDAACAAGTEHVVYPSTDKAIDPPSLYGATKRVVEAMLYAAAAAGGPRCTVARFVNVLGSRGSAPETFARQLAEGTPLSVTDRAMRRYWITPDHACLFLLHAACLKEQALTVVPDAGAEITVLEIARRLALALTTGADEPVITVTGSRPGERLSEPIKAAHETLERLSLPGIFAVRGTVPVERAHVDRVVSALARVLEGGSDARVVREAVFSAAGSLQSAT